MYHSMKIAGLDRNLPLCPLNEKLQIGAFVMFGDAELTVACAEELLKKAPEFDYIITAEAKGIPLAHEMSRQSGKKYFVARKKPKLYMTGVFDVIVNSITTEGEQHLYLDTAEAEMMKGKKVIIVEGAYSSHPYFENYADFKIFLKVDEEMQKKRILKRNGEEMLKRFINEWIPKENKYFNEFKIKEKADIIIRSV